MDFQQKKLEQGKVELTITLSALEMEPYVKLAASQIAQSTKIEGFRPGKAPYEVLVQRFGEMSIWQQAAENAIAHGYAEAVKKIAEQEPKFATVGQPDIQISKLAPNNDFVFTAVAALYPEVTLGDYRQIKVTKQTVKVDEEKIEKVLNDIRRMRAKESLVLRPAQLGDKVLLDFQLLVDKVAQEHGSEKNYPLLLGENRFIPGFEEQVLGLTPGQEKEFSLKFPENYWQKNLAGKLGDFKIKINEIYAIELPELNDEFAKGLGKFQTLAELKKEIAGNLRVEAADKEEQRLEQEILEALLKQAKFGDLPEVLLTNESHKMVHEVADNLAAQGLNFNDYLQHLKKTEKEFELELMPQATERVKTILLLRALQEDLKTEVTGDEIDREVAETAKLYEKNPEVQKQLMSEDYRYYVKGILANRKVLTWLKENCVAKN